MCSENDVAAIDVNMGCPKEFSIKVVLLQQCFAVSSVDCALDSRHVHQVTVGKAD